MSLALTCVFGSALPGTKAAETDTKGDMVVFAGEQNKVLNVSAATAGDDISWTLDDATHTLTVRGSGPMSDYSGSSAPWQSAAKTVKKIVVENGVTSLGNYAFSNFSALTDVSLPGSLAQIGVYAFRSCTALKEIRIPEGVQVIAAKAFSGCSALTTVSLPKTIANIDMKAFDGATAISDVYYAGTQIQWEQVDISLQASGNGSLLKAPRIHFAAQPLAPGEGFSDVKETDWYAEAIVYLVNYGYWQGSGDVVGVDAPVKRDVVLQILYQKDGSPGMYASPLDWAQSIGVLAQGSSEDFTLSDLVRLLYRVGRYNRELTPFADSAAGANASEAQTALDWAQKNGLLSAVESHLSLNPEEALPNKAAYTILAAYLQSSVSSADRYDALVATAKKALAMGGDGNMYILTPKKFELATQNDKKCGDCTVIIFPQGSTMMIDAGNKHCTGPVKQLLRDIGLTKLDYLVISHPHVDHVGGATAIANDLFGRGGSIGSCYLAAGVDHPTNRYYQKLKDLLASHGTAIHWDVITTPGKAYSFPTVDGVKIDAYNPTQAVIDTVMVKGQTGDGPINNLSIVMKFTYGSSTYLTGGDLYAERERTLVAEMKAAGTLNELRADVMKTNHHGIYTSSDPQWIDAVQPLIAISDADDSGNTLLWRSMTGRDAAFYTEGSNGLIMVVMGSQRDYDVLTQHDSSLWSLYHGTVGKRVAGSETTPSDPSTQTPSTNPSVTDDPTDDPTTDNSTTDNPSEGSTFPTDSSPNSSAPGTTPTDAPTDSDDPTTDGEPGAQEPTSSGGDETPAKGGSRGWVWLLALLPVVGGAAVAAVYWFAVRKKKKK